VSNKINLIFMGGFTYPHGMAGTRRIQHAIDALKEKDGVSIRVLVLRQSTQMDNPSGMHESVPYATMVCDVTGARIFTALPLLYVKTSVDLKRSWRADCKNIIYYYGSVNAENVVPLYYAHHLGYMIVFDIVEDLRLAINISCNPFHKVKMVLMRILESRLIKLASGIIVISSHLENKFRMLCSERLPIHFRPISINMRHFLCDPQKLGRATTLFYSGSFGQKDGLSILLDAFDKLAERWPDIRLVLSGKGNGEAMNAFYARVTQSPHKEKINYRGYLSDDEYYSVLNSADIPCVTRIDSGYACAGFPFKLGEFLATGKPVIVSRVSDVDRFLVHKHNAMLVKAGSSNEIYGAVEFLINNPNVAEAIGRRGREAADSFFDHKKQGKTLIRFLENI